MIITYIRSSMLGTYSWCPHKAYMEYVLGYKGAGNKKAEKGNVIHKVMEGLAHLKKCEQDGLLEFESEGLGLLQTKDVTPDLLLELSYKYYKDMSIHLWTDKDYKECKKWMDNALTFQNATFDPRKSKILEPEQIFDIEINEDWANYDFLLPDGTEIKGKLRIKGTIDLIVDLGDNVIEIVDYKTGKRFDWAKDKVKDFNSLCKDQQLLLYYYAATLLYPDKEILITIYYMNDGGPYTLPMGKPAIDAAKLMIKSKFEEVKSVLIPRRDISWKCTKLCEFGQKIAPGTGLTMCEHIHREILKKGIGKATIDNRSKGFDVTKYADGGGRKSKND